MRWINYKTKMSTGKYLKFEKKDRKFWIYRKADLLKRMLQQRIVSKACSISHISTIPQRPLVKNMKTPDFYMFFFLHLIQCLYYRCLANDT